jgi:BASS family bile acid:Na+ symporter
MTATALVQVLSMALLLAMMVAAGMKVPFEEVMASVRRPRLMLNGLLANFILTPLVTVALLHVFKAPPLVAAGLLIMAVCPGAAVGPPSTSIAKGNLSTAIGFMIVLALLSAFLSPTLAGLLLAHIPGAEHLQIDYVALIKTLLVTQLLPLVAALVFHHWKPHMAAKLVKPLDILANLILVALTVVALAAQYENLLKFSLGGWLGMLLLFAATVIIGWLLGGPDLADRKAMALTTGGRNSAPALVIASANFAGTPAVTMVIVYGFLMTIAALVCAFALRTIGAKVAEL